MSVLRFIVKVLVYIPIGILLAFLYGIIELIYNCSKHDENNDEECDDYEDE